MDKQRYIDFVKSNYIVSNFEVIYENEDKAVYAADTKKYGPVIIKLNDNVHELQREYYALKDFKGDNCVRLIDAFDGEMLVEEKIVPGNNLHEVTDTDERLACFATVFKAIHKIPNNYKMYPTYIDWLDDALQFCMENNVGEPLRTKMKLARDIGMELFDKYSERVLLHGDLHHENILLKNNGKYIIIDPKGVVGPSIFDIPRFILNELDDENDDNDEYHIFYVISKLSEMLGYDQNDIEKLFFMEMMLANIWCIEDNEDIDEQAIDMAYEILQSALQKTEEIPWEQ